MTRPPLHFTSEAYVDRPVGEVWELFTDLSRWSSWSPICRDCRLLTGTSLEVGSVFRMRLRIAGITVPVDATVVGLLPPVTMTWKKAWAFGVTAIHTYRFEPHGGGTRMVNEETFHGLLPVVRTLVGHWYRARGIGGGSLAGLQRVLT